MTNTCPHRICKSRPFSRAEAYASRPSPADKPVCKCDYCVAAAWRQTSGTTRKGQAANEPIVDASISSSSSLIGVDKSTLAFSARELVQATLPHRSPTGNPPIWWRQDGSYILTIRPGYGPVDPETGERHCFGYPYGSLPRLLLSWMTTEAIRTNNPVLNVGPTLAGFMRDLGLDPSRGGRRSDAARLKDQMRRLFRSTISFDDTGAQDRDRWLEMSITAQGDVWWNMCKSDQISLLDGYIELTPNFFNAITSSPIPTDKRALRALKASPLALDIYAWLSYRTYRVNQAKRIVRVSWRQLRQQLGTEISNEKEFGRRCRNALAKIRALYPQVKVEAMRGGIVIRPGPYIIAPR